MIRDSEQTEKAIHLIHSLLKIIFVHLYFIDEPGKIQCFATKYGVGGEYDQKQNPLPSVLSLSLSH